MTIRRIILLCLIILLSVAIYLVIPKEQKTNEEVIYNCVSVSGVAYECRDCSEETMTCLVEGNKTILVSEFEVAN